MKTTESSTKLLVRKFFETYLGAKVLSVGFPTQRREIAVLVSKLQFPIPTSGVTPERFRELQHHHLVCVLNAIVNGDVHLIVQDEIHCLFNAWSDVSDPLNSAITTAKNILSEAKKQPPLNTNEFKLGIGIDIGQMVISEIGDPRRKQITAFGLPGLSARKFASETSGKIRISTSVLERIHSNVLMNNEIEAI